MSDDAGGAEHRDTKGRAEAITGDPRLALVYQEALRGLLQQQAAVESIRNRTATLVFAASFATSPCSAVGP